MAWDDLDLDSGPVPLWFQIRERLRDAIEQGEFAPGDALPPESMLNRRFGISRTTARAALDSLENDGLVRRRSGHGSIVLEPRVDQPLNLLASFAEDMVARGRKPGYRTRSVIAARMPAEVASAFELRRGTRAIAIDRLLLADDQPMAVTLAWLGPQVIPVQMRPDTTEFNTTSLYEWIEATTGRRIARGEEYIEAAVANTELADRLEIMPGEPVLVARRLSRTADGTPVEYVATTYRADRYRFRIELVRP
ncbi:MAG: GntR family transcriptional regulator [Mycobacterium sp.]|jgi:GntR family transcriptional regulator|nr:GntR family transcriptional regulator [Mycobacterium sp.]